MIQADKLCYRSKLRYANSVQKFAFCIITLCICLISRSFAVAVCVFLVNSLLTVCKGKIPFSVYMRFLRIPTVFLIIGTLAVVVNVSGSPMDLFAVSFGDWYITASHTSVIYGLRLCAVAMSSVTCLYFLSLNTTMTDIVGVLERLRCPLFLTELMMLIYRFIFILLETASAIITAQKSRLGYGSLRSKIRCFGTMGVTLFIRSLKRSEVLYDAMESRCYDGRICVLKQENPPDRKVTFLITGFAVILILTAVVF